MATQQNIEMYVSPNGVDCNKVQGNGSEFIKGVIANLHSSPNKIIGLGLPEDNGDIAVIVGASSMNIAPMIVFNPEVYQLADTKTNLRYKGVLPVNNQLISLEYDSVKAENHQHPNDLKEEDIEEIIKEAFEMEKYLKKI